MSDDDWVEITAVGDSHQVQMRIGAWGENVYRHRPLVLRHTFGQSSWRTVDIGEWKPGLPEGHHLK